MARIVENTGTRWRTEALANEIHTYAQHGQFSIEVGRHRLELSASEAADLFARAFDVSAETSPHMGGIIALAKVRAHKVPA